MARDIFYLEKHYRFPFFEKLLFTCQKETKKYVMVWFHAYGQSIKISFFEYLLSLTFRLESIQNHRWTKVNFEIEKIVKNKYTWILNISTYLIQTM